jgi:hopanoid biosynthesis associated protein HpnK
MGRLIVNADDFGLTHGVNRAIAELHHAGLVTSATLMARANATADAIQWGRDTPSLGVGCHVVLMDGDPVLPPGEIPTLVDPRTNRLHATLSSFLSRLIRGRIRAEEMEAEAQAQIAWLHTQGVALTHIDTHKHLHMFPGVLQPLLRAARAAGICAVRNPFEPAWSLRATLRATRLRRMEVRLLHRMLPRFQRIVKEEGFITTDGSIGVLATGSLDVSTVRSLLDNLPAGTWELVTHPGYNDADLAAAPTRLLASRDKERDALLALKQFPALELISFAALHGEGNR